MFGRVMVHEAPQGMPANIGSRVIDRHAGVLEFAIYAPTDTGFKNAAEVTEFVGNLFRRQSITLADQSLVVMRVPGYTNSGPMDNVMGNLMRIEYYRDEIAR